MSFNGFKPTKFDKILDWLVYIVGTDAAFIVMWLLVALWIILGGVLGFSQTWQVVMSDGQSIQTYIWDTFLMRQQLIQSYEQSLIWAEFRSRASTFRRLVPLALQKKELEVADASDFLAEVNDNEVSSAMKLPAEGWFDTISTFISVWLGSAPAIIIYWIGIFVWVGCGALWSDALNDPPYTGDRTGDNPK